MAAEEAKGKGLGAAVDRLLSRLGIVSAASTAGSALGGSAGGGPGSEKSPSPLERQARRGIGLAVLAGILLATASEIMTAVSAVTSSPEGAWGFFRSFFPFVALRRPQPPWGRVVEERTNLPVRAAAVAILDAQGKPRESVTSRADGAFGALLPRGQWRLTVHHPRYAFLPAPEGVVLFPEEKLYAGGLLEIEKEEDIPRVVLGVRPLEARRATLWMRFRPWVERLRVLQARLAIPILLLGATTNTVALVLDPRPLLIGFEVLYGVFLAFELLLSRVARRALGRVRDSVRKSPVSLAIVRLLDPDTDRLVATRVTPPSGRFLLMPPPGRYLLQVAHAAYLPYRKERVNVRRGNPGALRMNVELQPRGSR